ncbi:MAG: methyltransferase [Clostridia bacterium]
MSHYFIQDETLQSQKKEITYYYYSHKLDFTTDVGVFSKDHVDPATDILLRNIPPIKGSLLDLGCGYGVIGISLFKQFGIELTQSDVNQTALDLTKENCEKNGVNSKIIKSYCFNEIGESFDTITLNPPIHAGKVVTYQMYEEAFAHLNKGGKLFVVTLKKHGAETTITKLKETFGNCETIYKKKAYYVLSCVKS